MSKKNAKKLRKKILNLEQQALGEQAESIKEKELPLLNNRLNINILNFVKDYLLNSGTKISEINSMQEFVELDSGAGDNFDNIVDYGKTHEVVQTHPRQRAQVRDAMGGITDVERQGFNGDIKFEYVPNLATTLVSVAQICDHHAEGVIFTKNGAYLVPKGQMPNAMDGFTSNCEFVKDLITKHNLPCLSKRKPHSNQTYQMSRETCNKYLGTKFTDKRAGTAYLRKIAAMAGTATTKTVRLKET